MTLIYIARPYLGKKKRERDRKEKKEGRERREGKEKGKDGKGKLQVAVRVDFVLGRVSLNMMKPILHF